MARLARNFKKKSALQKKSPVQTPKTSDRAARAEWRDLARQLQEERARKTELQNCVLQLEADLVSFTQGDGGTAGDSDARAGGSFGITYQNQWNQLGCSQTLTFPSPEACTCRSVEEVDGNDMPGNFARDPFEETGLFSQSILIRGSSGYTMIGFVSTDDDKQNLLMKTIADWSNNPLMKAVGFGGEYETFTINVDMVNRSAKLYAGSRGRAKGETSTAAFSELQPIETWEILPNKLWLGVSFKRRTKREAVLLPGTHWKV